MGALGAKFRAKFGVLGVKLGALGVKLGFLGAKLGTVGAHLGVKGAKFGDSGCQVEALRPKLVTLVAKSGLQEPF